MLTVFARAAAALYRYAGAAALALAALTIAMTPASAQQPQRIVAVGDLHGDYDAWADIARAAGLTDARGNWAAGKTIFVQMGDITDRGPDSLKIVRSLQQLQRQAPAKGGRVVVILGNHEAMNTVGDYRYTTPGEYAAFVDDQSPVRRDRTYELNRARIEANARARDPNLSPTAIREAWLKETPLGWAEHRLAWSPQGELGQWAANNPAIAKIDGTLFVHGGLSAEYSKLPLDVLNRRTMLAMRTGVGGAGSVLDDPLGPLWYRGLAMRDPDAEAARVGETGTRPTQAQELDAVLAAYGAQRMVIAHTPNLKGIIITNDGKLARIDTGISRYYGGPLTFLEIVGNQMIPHVVARSTP